MARVIAQTLTGQKIGKWTVGESFQHPTRRERMYYCVCDCGTKRNLKHSHLKNGKTRSCGCSWTTHGKSNSNEYRIWDSMLRRCIDPNHHAYKNYGGRGIAVCEKWKGFSGFFEDMGSRPIGMTLERIDNSLGYSKDNCKWATVTEQARNRRTTKLDENKVTQIKSMIADGVSLSVIASNFGVSRTNIGHIAKGLTWEYVA